MYILTPEEMRNIDNRGIEKFGIPGVILMENAAIRAFDIIWNKYENTLKESFTLILAGGGNNGGDGLAIARHIMLRGRKVKVFLFAKKDKIEGDARINLDMYERLGGKVVTIEDSSQLECFEKELRVGGLVIDSLLGTGIDRDIQGPMKEAIELINKSSLPIVAIDIPSGVNGKTGKIMGTATKANTTITFAFAKRGHILYPGRVYSGKLHIVPISLPKDSGKAMDIKTFSLDDKEASDRLIERPKDGHKGTFGKIGIIAGSLGMAGATSLTSMAALKAGGGLVTLACPQPLVPIVQTNMREVMAQGLGQDDEDYLTSNAISKIHEFLLDKDVLGIGPGLGLKCEGLEILRYILEEFDIPIVVDADGLNHISKEKELLKSCRGPLVITPHPGEMARLLGRPIEDILENPIEIANKFAKKMGIVVLLKGATSIVADPDGRVYLNWSGNSGMGTAGSGDVLTGLVTSLIGQGYKAFDAAVLGCYIHGRAGDYAMEAYGKVGMVAGDILDNIPRVFRYLYSIQARL